MFEGNLVLLLVKGVNSGSRLSAGESAFDSELYHTEEGQQQHEADWEMQVDGVDVEAPGLSGQETGRGEQAGESASCVFTVFDSRKHLIPTQRARSCHMSTKPCGDHRIPRPSHILYLFT